MKLDGHVCDFCGGNVGKDAAPLRRAEKDVLLGSDYFDAQGRKYKVGLALEAVVLGVDGGGYGSSYINALDLCGNCREKFKKELFGQLVDPDYKIPALANTLKQFTEALVRLQRDFNDHKHNANEKIQALESLLEDTQAEIANHRLHHQRKGRKPA